MAKSTAEQIRELTAELGALRERDEFRREMMAELKGDLRDEREARHKVELELTDLRRQFQEHLAQYQERDKRRWGVVGILIGAGLALTSNVIVALVKK